MPCEELSINLAVLAPNDTQQFSFGLTKGCNADDSEFWIIDFVFRDRPDTSSDFQDRVRLHVQLGNEDSAAAAKLKAEGLTGQDLAFVGGPMTNRAKKLPRGTTDDEKLSSMAKAIVDQHAVV